MSQVCLDAVWFSVSAPPSEECAEETKSKAKGGHRGGLRNITGLRFKGNHAMGKQNRARLCSGLAAVTHSFPTTQTPHPS